MGLLRGRGLHEEVSHEETAARSHRGHGGGEVSDGPL